MHGLVMGRDGCVLQHDANHDRHSEENVERFVRKVSETKEVWVDAKYFKPIWPDEEEADLMLRMRGGRGKGKPMLKAMSFEAVLVSPPGIPFQVSSWGRFRRMRTDGSWGAASPFTPHKTAMFLAQVWQNFKRILRNIRTTENHSQLMVLNESSMFFKAFDIF